MNFLQGGFHPPLKYDNLNSKTHFGKYEVPNASPDSSGILYG